MFLTLNENNNYNNYPFLCAICNDNIEMVLMIINCANIINMKLKINERNLNDYHLIMTAINKNNQTMVKLLIDYTNKNDINFNQFDKKYKNHTFSVAIFKNNTEIIKIIIDYASSKDILLPINE